jgi:hypothetical protein
MNHVLSFDIKVWDPGAPVFAVQTSSAGATGLPTAIIPGDPGYNGSTGYVSGGGALPRFINNPSPNNKTEQLSSLGAYVDLNYMYYNNCANNWPNALTRYARTLYGNNSIIVNSQSNQSYNYFLANNSVGITGVAQLLPLPWFHLPPNPSSGIITITTNTSTNNYPGGYASIWDTWSTHYEHDGIDNDHDGLIDEGTDGIDNAANGLANSANVKSIIASPGIDDAAELEAPPPYRYPLRGIQIKIRAYESDTKQVREVTLVHEFLQE